MNGGNMRRLVAPLLAIALLATLTPGASAFVHSLTLYDGASGGDPHCGGYNSEVPNLAAAGASGGCGNWDNRATSFRASLNAGQCVALYTGAFYTGLMAWTAGTLTVNLPGSMNNAVTSFRFGVPGGGTCGAPWT